MKVCFELSMPNVGSWNGKWTGANNLYARIVDFGRGKANEARAQEILDAKSYYYNFGDGWGASVGVRAVDSKEAAKIRKATRGFCGYDWMIDSIRQKGRIEI
jgi:hypothetical protein